MYSVVSIDVQVRQTVPSPAVYLNQPPMSDTRRALIRELERRPDPMVFDVLTVEVMATAFAQIERWDLRVDSVELSSRMYRDLVNSDENQFVEFTDAAASTLFGVSLTINPTSDMGYVRCDPVYGVVECPLHYAEARDEMAA